MVTRQSANQLKTPAKVSWVFKMVSQFDSLGYTIMGKTADLIDVQLKHEFHYLSWITEINKLFQDILIYWDAPVVSNGYLTGENWNVIIIIIIIINYYNYNIYIIIIIINLFVNLFILIL